MFSFLKSLFTPRVKREKEIVMRVHPDGTRYFVWSDEFPIAEHGTVKPMRASRVEFNEATQLWEVTFEGESRIAFSHASRTVCIDWEVIYIQNNFTTFTDRLFPTES